MVYLDITTEDSAKALATLENENDRKVTPKWKNADGSLVNFCGLRNKKNWKKIQTFFSPNRVKSVIYLKSFGFYKGLDN